MLSLKNKLHYLVLTILNADSVYEVTFTLLHS